MWNGIKLNNTPTPIGVIVCRKNIFTLNFQIDDHFLKIRNVLVQLGGLALVSSFVCLRHIDNDKSKGRHSVFASIVRIARSKNFASYIPSQARLRIPTHFAFQSESFWTILHWLNLAGAVKRYGLCKRIDFIRFSNFRLRRKKFNLVSFYIALSVFLTWPCGKLFLVKNLVSCHHPTAFTLNTVN